MLTLKRCSRLQNIRSLEPLRSLVPQICKQYSDTSYAIALELVKVRVLCALLGSRYKYSIQVLVYRLYWFEHRQYSDQSRTIIMNSCRVVVIKVCCNRFIEVCHGDNPGQQILQHTEEEHAHITVILADSSMPVATCCSPSAVAVPCMDSHIPDEEGRILHLLVHRISRSC